MLITAFKRTGGLVQSQAHPFLFYEPPTLEHIHRLFSETQYGEWLLNTRLLGVLVVLITFILSVPPDTPWRAHWAVGEKLGIASS